MRLPLGQPEERSPYRTTHAPVVLRQLCRTAERSTALYRSEDWRFVRDGLSDRSRAETAQALRAVAFIALRMAQSLEEEPRSDDREPPTTS
jgi:hypothetical protein